MSKLWSGKNVNIWTLQRLHLAHLLYPIFGIFILLKQPYHFWATQRCLTVLPAQDTSSLWSFTFTLHCNAIDLERCAVWGSLGECCWPSETPLRRAGAVDGELGAPNASLILDIDGEFSLKVTSPTGWPISRTPSASCGSGPLRRGFSSSCFSRSSHRCEVRECINLKRKSCRGNLR